eukprot:scaffold10027_cov114-Isochrysis_galbana.AAC.4
MDRTLWVLAIASRVYRSRVWCISAGVCALTLMLEGKGRGGVFSPQPRTPGKRPAARLRLAGPGTATTPNQWPGSAWSSAQRQAGEKGGGDEGGGEGGGGDGGGSDSVGGDGGGGDGGGDEGG